MASISPARRALARAPWSRGAWRDTAFAVSGVPLQCAGWTILGAPWAFFAPEDMTMVALVAVVSCALLLLVIRPLTAAQRERCWAMLGLEIPRLDAVDGADGGRLGVLRDLRSPELWRVLRYHLLAGPLLAFGGLATVTAWTGAFLLGGLGAYAWALPDSSPLSLTTHATRTAALTAVGVALLAAAPWIAAAVRGLDVRAAVAYLGPDRAKELERRVEDLAEKRASVVDAADIERRRIERDLHDGAQQRLVSSP
ncbi:sensor domain-containing protein [Actinomadura yumaensis]|uniref:sensor domain-containing protein n=1 Tax=Actinomadura yumaensis TaxID=111807 RepID=UPI003610704D